jgi:hypothetical protein
VDGGKWRHDDSRSGSPRGGEQHGWSVRKILPNLLGPERVRWLVKILRKIADDANVGFCGTMGGIVLKFLQHFLA